VWATCLFFSRLGGVSQDVRLVGGGRGGPSAAGGLSHAGPGGSSLWLGDFVSVFFCIFQLSFTVCYCSGLIFTWAFRWHIC
jgi:hypothetical protein